MTSTYRVVAAGESRVGKSLCLECISGRYTTSEYKQTVGVDFHSVVTRHGDRMVKCQTWDLGGAPQFREITYTYLRDTEAMLLFYDVGCRESFESLGAWVTKWNSFREGRPIIIIGAKADKQDVVGKAAETYAASVGAKILRVSIVNGKGLDNVIPDLVDAIDDARSDNTDRSGPTDGLLGKRRDITRYMCCTIL